MRKLIPNRKITFKRLLAKTKKSASVAKRRKSKLDDIEAGPDIRSKTFSGRLYSGNELEFGDKEAQQNNSFSSKF